MVIVQQTVATRHPFIEGFVFLADISKPAPAPDAHDRELGSIFAPKFDDRGLLSAVVTDASSGEVLMVAFMNGEALKKTLDTGRAHFWSRSRKALWMKGETSGNVLEVKEVLVDCDQDALVIKAHPAGPACHTGAQTCFYRRYEGGALVGVKT